MTSCETDVCPAEGTPFHLAIPVHDMIQTRKVNTIC